MYEWRSRYYSSSFSSSLCSLLFFFIALRSLPLYSFITALLSFLACFFSFFSALASLSCFFAEGACEVTTVCAKEIVVVNDPTVISIIMIYRFIFYFYVEQ